MLGRVRLRGGNIAGEFGSFQRVCELCVNSLVQREAGRTRVGLGEQAAGDRPSGQVVFVAPIGRHQVGGALCHAGGSLGLLVGKLRRETPGKGRAPGNVLRAGQPLSMRAENRIVER